MEAVWAKDTDIQCGHPGWRILRGWGPVMESWKRIFENTPTDFVVHGNNLRPYMRISFNDQQGIEFFFADATSDFFNRARA